MTVKRSGKDVGARALMQRGYPFALPRTNRKSERGQTIVLVAISMLALLAMAALAVDVTTLYIARSEAEKAAAAGALAGARTFVTSGFTSGGLGPPNSASAQSLVCNNSTGFADLQAKTAATQNLIAGKAPASVITACSFPTPQNPRISVTVQGSDLPTFFSRIWGAFDGQVTAASSAEAYNPSGQTVPIQVASVKPWLVANCDYGNHAPGLLNPKCPLSIPGGLNADYFVDPANDYAVANNGSFIGQHLRLQQVLPTLVPGLPMPSLLDSYFALDIPIDVASASCPALSGVSCGGLNPASPGYPETIACANATPISCGDQVKIAAGGGILLSSSAVDAPKCLIHSSGDGLNKGQDIFTPPVFGDPILIEGGSNNPDVSLQGKPSISRSDSVVTVPLWDGNGLLLGPGATVRVVGFLQLGIEEVRPGLFGLTSEIDGLILNASGCGTASGTPVSGAKISPIPVRLVQ
jgi:hypothetical protein